MKNLKEIKNSTLLKELQRRMKLREIRFNYDHPYSDQKITGLISWNALDEYYLDFAEIEKREVKEQVKFSKEFNQRWKELTKTKEPYEPN